MSSASIPLAGAGPLAQAVRYASAPWGTTVTLNAYAAAVGGTAHELDGIGKERLLPPVIDGPPNVPVGFLVSRTRHGGKG